jgi:WD40 repeat protein
MITYSCPKCRQLLSVAEAAAASPNRCPKCGHVGVPRLADAGVTATLAPPMAATADAAAAPRHVPPPLPSPSTAPTAAQPRHAPPPLPSAVTATGPGVSLDATQNLPFKAADAGGATMSGPAAAPTMPMRSSRAPKVPGYEVFEELGRGAMGVVWKARQVGLNRLVALKTMRSAAHSSSQHLARFKTEAEALARVQHPNIVPIHEVGEANGLPYFAMEYFPGGTLTRRLRGLPLPPREAVKLMATLARAVEHAHRAGIVHRDIKPSNILMAPDGSPRIGDFGLAKIVDAAAGPTITGTVLGTPSYMAPEQAMDAKHTAGPAADVYALGAVFYQLLTGGPPFRSTNAGETLMQVLRDKPVPPSRLQRGLSRDLDTICLKCLEKAPARRYASAAALGEDLERFLAGTPILARPVSLPVRGLAWARRRPAAAALLLLSAVMALGATVGLLWFARQEQRNRHAAEDLGNKAEQALQKADEARLNAVQQAKLETESRELAESQQKAAEQANRQAKRGNAELYLERGRELCKTGKIRLGLLWIAKSVSLAADEPDLQQICRMNLAGWLKHLQPRLRMFLAHDRALAIAFSPNGQQIATGNGESDGGSGKSSVALHDVATGKLLYRVVIGDDVAALAWSRDGRLVAVSSGAGNRSGGWGKAGKGTVHILDAATGKLRETALGHPSTVRSVAFQPDGKMLLTGCQDGKARIWDVTTGMLDQELKLTGAVLSVAYTSGGAALMTVSEGRNAEGKGQCLVQTWELVNGKTREGRSFVLPQHLNYAAINRDSSGLLTMGDGRLGAWDVALTAAEFGQKLGKSASIGGGGYDWGGSVSDDRTLIAQCGKSWQTLVYRIDTNEQLGQTLLGNGWVFTTEFSPDGKLLAIGDGGNPSLWDLTSNLEQRTQLLEVDRVHNLAFSPDGRRLAALLDGNKVQLFDSRTGKPAGPPLPHSSGIPSLALSENNRTVITGCYDSRVRVWNAETGKLIHEQPWVFPVAVDTVAFSADGRFAITGCRDGKAQVWDIATGKPVGQALVHSGELTAVALSRDGSRAFTGDSTFQVRGWDMRTGQPLNRPIQLTGRPTCLTPSRDGRRILVGTAGDNSARLLDMETALAIGPPLAHADAVQSVAFSSDESMIATGSSWGEGAAHLWDTATGKALGPPIRHKGAVFALRFAPDRAELWTAGADRQVLATDIPTAASGSAPYLDLLTRLQVGMFLDRDNVEHNLQLGSWLQVRKAVGDAGAK